MLKNIFNIHLAFKYFKEELTILFYTILLSFFGCTKEEVPKTAKINYIDTIKPVVNVYIDNTGSMRGYVNGLTEFELYISDYLTHLINSGYISNINLFFINNFRIIPVTTPDIIEFFRNIEPSTFGGSYRNSDIAMFFSKILENTDSNEVAVFITDGIFSNDFYNENDNLLSIQQHNIYNATNNYLMRFPNTVFLLYALESSFRGYYYNNYNQGIYINSKRPFYIWTMGNYNYIKKLVCNYSPYIGAQNNLQSYVYYFLPLINTYYAVDPSSGKFDLNKNNPRTSLENFESNYDGFYTLSINADFRDLLFLGEYLLDSSYYVVDNFSNNFSISIKRLENDNQNFTHKISLKASNIYQGNLKVIINLRRIIPNWIYELNTDDGDQPYLRRTFGFQYQINGIKDAFNSINKYLTTLTINIEQ